MNLKRSLLIFPGIDVRVGEKTELGHFLAKENRSFDISGTGACRIRGSGRRVKTQLKMTQMSEGDQGVRAIYNASLGRVSHHCLIPM